VSATGEGEARATVGGDGTVAVAGPLTFDTVPQAFRLSAVWLQQPARSLTLNLSGVSRADSAGLALLVEWLRLAKTQGHTLAFTHVPEQMRSLIRVNGLDKVLGV
jgi:phospholipid transport system transporter-binding protein